MRCLLSLGLVGLLPGSLYARQGASPADLVLRHAAVYTVSAVRAWGHAVAVRAGRVVAVGTDREVQRFIGPKTRVVDLAGRMVLPGFHDSHVHPVSAGLKLAECDLSPYQTRDALVARIRSCAKNLPGLWLRGAGWPLPMFPAANPNRQLLDSLVPDRPAFFVAADGHSGWANSLALRAAGITRATADPARGRIEHDATGEPSGTLREDAVGLVSAAAPPRTRAEDLAGLRRGLKEANAFGITSFIEASAGEPELEAYAALDHAGELSARVVAAMHVDPARGVGQIPTLKAWRARFRGRHLRATSAKIFADGVIEAHTAALLEPYVDLPNQSGTPNLEPEAFNRLVVALDHEGFQVHVHAIGDRAIRMALDAFQNAQGVNGIRDSRHLIAHVQLLEPEDIPRFRSLGVIADYQPLWAFRDSYISELTEPVLGPARSRWLYPIGSTVQSGAIVAAGSDWFVSSLNPLDAIEVALTRRDLGDSTGASWIPEERVDLPTMIAAYTINGAYAAGQERETGSIEVGKAADLVVLDQNLFAIPVYRIHKVKVLLTLLEGREVFRDSTFRP